MRSPDTSTWLISWDLICATKTWWATNVMVIVVVAVEGGVLNKSEVQHLKLLDRNVRATNGI